MKQKGITDKICNNINYNTYKKIDLFTDYGSISSLILYFISIFNGMGIELAVLPFMMTFTGLSIFFLNPDNTKKTKDIKELLKVYKLFLENYNELNKMFEFKNPVEISTMFNHLLYNGYLSKDKKFVFSNDGVIDFMDMGSLNIFDGRGVCRHISRLLNDILNIYGMKSEKMDVYQRDANMDDEALNMYLTKLLKEAAENMNNQNDELFDANYYKDMVTKFVNLEEINVDKIKRKKISNHAINYVEHDGVGYYLDATQGDIYQKNDDSLFLHGIVDELLYIVSNPKYKYLSSNDRKEDFEISAKTKILCDNNLDVFEKFYKDNNELYHDIVQKSLILKPKKS